MTSLKIFSFGVVLVALVWGTWWFVELCGIKDKSNVQRETLETKLEEAKLSEGKEFTSQNETLTDSSPTEESQSKPERIDLTQYGNPYWEKYQLSSFDAWGNKITTHIEKHCLRVRSSDSYTLRETWNDHIKESINKLRLGECAIVKLMEIRYPMTIPGLNCNQTHCSLSKEKLSKTDEDVFGFWFQDYFNVTEKNIDYLEENPHFNRYTCIKPDGTSGLEENGVCIRNVHSFDPFDYSIFENDYVVSFLAKNLKNYTHLTGKIATKINYTNIPNGTEIYSYFGKKQTSAQNYSAFVLPSERRLTKEAVSWMRHDRRISSAICHSFGLRKLDAQEIDALPMKSPDLNCFLDENGKIITKNESIVWAFGWKVGTFSNHLEITDNDALKFAFDNRDVLVLKNFEFEVPDGWLKINNNTYLKNNGSRVIGYLGHLCNNFTNNTEFKDFLENGGFVIMKCTDYQENSEFQHYNISNRHLLCSKSTKDIKIFKENLLQSSEGEKFFVRYAEIPIGITSLTHIHPMDCRELVKERNADSVDSEFRCIGKYNDVKIERLLK